MVVGKEQQFHAVGTLAGKQHLVAVLEFLLTAHAQALGRDLLKVAVPGEEQMHRVVGNLLFRLFRLDERGRDFHRRVQHVGTLAFGLAVPPGLELITLVGQSRQLQGAAFGQKIARGDLLALAHHLDAAVRSLGYRHFEQLRPYLQERSLHVQRPRHFNHPFRQGIAIPPFFKHITGMGFRLERYHAALRNHAAGRRIFPFYAGRNRSALALVNRKEVFRNDFFEFGIDRDRGCQHVIPLLAGIAVPPLRERVTICRNRRQSQYGICRQIFPG